MRIISRSALVKFWTDHAISKAPLSAWFREVKIAKWKTPNDVKGLYPKASILASGRIVFDIKGNNYRVVVKINYKAQVVYIRFVGTHAEYDKIDAENV